MDVLVVIDMQELYREDLQARRIFDPLVDRITRRIERYRNRRDGRILCLATDAEGEIIPKIKRHLVRGDATFLFKQGFSGARTIYQFLEKQTMLENTRIELCGIYENCCVLRTWQGLKKKGAIVLPVKKNLTVPTTFRRRGRAWRYPRGYLIGESEMSFLEAS